MTDVSDGTRVKASPIVDNAGDGSMHEVFTGTVVDRFDEDTEPFVGEDIVMVDPDGDDGPRPVRVSNVEVEVA